jgi:hypothetical protein
MRGRLTGVAVATTMLVAGSGIALAQSAGGGGQHGAGDATATGELLGDEEAEVVVETGGRGGNEDVSGSGGGGGGSDITCRLVAPTGFNQGAVLLTVEDLTAMYESSGGPVPVVRTCHDATGSMLSSENIMWQPSDGGPVALVDPEVLAQWARERMSWPSPSVATSPPVNEGTYAQLSTFFHVVNWEPVTSPPATAGAAWATVTGTPVRQSWVIRDTYRGTSETITCDGPGSFYDPSVPLEAQTPACGWTPTHSSDGQTHTSPHTGEPCFPATVTLTWDVSWASNVVAGGPLGQGTSDTSVCLVVAEVQATVVASQR